MKHRQPHSDETKAKISVALIGNRNGVGRIVSEQNKEELRQAHLGKHLSQQIKDKISKTMTGQKHTLERRVAKSKLSQGESNRFWKHGLSKLNKTERQLAMNTLEYKLWRTAVFGRDSYQCVLGGTEHGDKLNADHIKSWAEYPESRYEVSNGQTLCEACHRKTASYGNRNKVYGLSSIIQPAMVEPGNQLTPK